ncbi:TetR/AcrR family transcriptional regulator [Mycobacterium hodleri]|uniref:TetR/AcrR family transcriptional regulator n=1 Tax=Mycolicibacterium hodleri TaxID=49897 RepID=UPI0021F34EC2|nr:TetR/AcrR family transcriptional regulator [Mycolicibacterium hodleri]MCV7133042.1 TetR/AcrR family transcriptional regulator [Mycolicibacterium hodleri]
MGANAGQSGAAVQRRLGAGARDLILDAAAELFTDLGYAGTSTRAIADAVGIRQPSLYNYFKTKEDIACALLNQTVTPTLDLIPHLLGTTPTGHLHALAVFDGGRLINRRWNLGTLYLQPELRSPGLSPFWQGHDRLRWHYLNLSQSVLAETEIGRAAAELPFRMVESLVFMWDTEPGPDRDDLPTQVADACLRVLGVEESHIARIRATSHELLDRYAASQSAT